MGANSKGEPSEEKVKQDVGSYTVRIRSATMSVCPLSIDQIQVEIVCRYMQVEEEVRGREHDVDSEGEQVV